MTSNADPKIFLAVELAGGRRVEIDFRRIEQAGTRAMTALDRSARGGVGGLTRLDSSSKALDRTTKGLTATQSRFRDKLRDTAATLAVVQGPLGPIAGRFTALAAAMGRVGIAGGVVIGVIAAVSAGVIGGARAAARAERQFERIEKQIRATGFAAGQTSADIQELSDDLATDTFAGREGARDAASVLLTFRSVRGDTFERALRLSQDLAEVFGGDLRTAAVRLGRVLEDPARNMDGLGRSGVVLNDALRSQIRLLQETGDRAAAVALILKTLEDRVGGAGAGEGVSAEVDTLGDKWTEMLEKLGATGAVQAGTEAFLTAVETAIDGTILALDRLEDAPLGKRFAAVASEIAELKVELDQAQSALKSPDLSDTARASARDEVALLSGLMEEARRTQADLGEELLALQSDRRAAIQGAILGDMEAARDDLSGLLRSIDDATSKLSGNKAGQIRSEFEKTIAQIESLVKKFPELGPQGDRARFAAESLLDSRLARLPQGQDQRILAELVKQEALQGLRTPRARAIETTGRRVGPDSRGLARAAQARIFDAKQGEANEKVVEGLREELRLLGLTTEAREAANASRRVAGESAASESQRIEAVGLAAAISAARTRQADEKRLETLRQEIALVGLSEESLAQETAAQEVSNAAKAQARSLGLEKLRREQAAANRDLADSLEEEVRLLGLSNRENEIAVALSTVAGRQTAIESAAMRDLAVRLVEAREARRVMNQSIREGESLTLSLRTAQEVFDDELARSLELYNQGIISLETLRRNTERLTEELNRSNPVLEAWKDTSFETVGILRDLADGTETLLGALERLADFLVDRFVFDPLFREIEGVIDRIGGPNAGQIASDVQTLGQNGFGDQADRTIADNPDIFGGGANPTDLLADTPFDKVGEEARKVGETFGELGTAITPSVAGLGEQIPGAVASTVLAETGAAVSSQVGSAVTNQATTTTVAASGKTVLALVELTAAAEIAAAALATVGASRGGGNSGAGLLSTLFSAASGGAGAGFAGGGSAGFTAFASGGRPRVGDLSLVGERGPEPFIADRPGRILSNLGARQEVRAAAASRDGGGRGGARPGPNVQITGPLLVVEAGGGRDFSDFGGEGETIDLLLERALPSLVAAMEDRLAGRS